MKLYLPVRWAFLTKYCQFPFKIPKVIAIVGLVFLCFIQSIAFSQTSTVSGKVVSSEDGAAIPGASILLKGTSVGTATDVDGTYSLQVPNLDGTLVFSFIGYVSQEVAINNRSSIDVSLAS